MISKISSIQKIALRYLTARLMDEVFPSTKPANMEPLDAFSAADNLREEMGFLYIDLVKKVPQWKDFERKFTFLATRSKTEDAFRKSALREYRRDLQTIAIKINERDFSRALLGLYGEAEILNHLSQNAGALDIERVAKALFVVGKGAFTEIALREIYESASHYAERHKQDRKQEVIDFFEGLPLPRGAYGSIHLALREGEAEEVAEEIMESLNEENISNPPRFAREILVRVEECKQEMSERLMGTLSETREDILSQMRENFGGDLEAKHEALFRRLGMDALESVSEKAVREAVNETFEEKMNPSYETLKARAQANRNKEKRDEERAFRKRWDL